MKIKHNCYLLKPFSTNLLYSVISNETKIPPLNLPTHHKNKTNQTKKCSYILNNFKLISNEFSSIRTTNQHEMMPNWDLEGIVVVVWSFHFSS